MKKMLLICILACCNWALPVLADTNNTDTPKKIVGYFTAWGVYGRNYHISDIPAKKITHLIYAFANISPEGTCVLGDPYADTEKFYDGDSWSDTALRGSFNQIKKLKKKHPHVKALMAIGGWSWSGRFSDVALTEKSREKFVNSCVALIDKYPMFDGLDIDWEYPVEGGLPDNTTRPEDKENYTLLAKQFREKLGSKRLLTLASPAGQNVLENFELGKLAQYIDWFNVMAYDYHGAWEEKTDLNAPLYAAEGDAAPKHNVNGTVDYYLNQGVPKQKIVLGLPFYGRGYGGVERGDNNGLHQLHTGPSHGTWEPGFFDYKDLTKSYVHNYEKHTDALAHASWLYDEPAKVMISYDDVNTIIGKANYILERELGGAMFWEFSGDDSNPKDSLLESVYTTLNKNNGEAKKNRPRASKR